MNASKKKLSIELTEHIAQLGHLELTDEETQKFTVQMNSILAHFEQLTEVNVDGIEPTTHVMDIKNVFRLDEIQPSLTQDQALENAPQKKEGFIIAPRIV